jgi:hypothetical protein
LVVAAIEGAGIVALAEGSTDALDDGFWCPCSESVDA